MQINVHESVDAIEGLREALLPLLPSGGSVQTVVRVRGVARVLTRVIVVSKVKERREGLGAAPVAS